MTGVLRRLRTAIDLYGRWSWRYRMTTLGSLLAAYGIVSALVQVPLPVNLLLAVIGASVSVHEIREHRRENLAISFVPREADHYEDVVRDTGGTVGISSASGVGLFFTGDSEAIRGRSISASLDANDFVAHESLEKWSLAFLGRGQRGRSFFNGNVVGLSSWSLGDSHDGDVVQLRRCGYFDFIATNLLAGCDVESASGSQLLGRQLFLDRNGKLRSFSSSRLANVIGVSTLAITEDGKLLLVQQTDKNVGSPRTRAPSGSGALEVKDLPGPGQPQFILQEVIARGAARELSEECNILREEIQSTHVIGFGRWLTRGAMPEFSALTFVQGEADTIVGRPKRRDEREYVDRVRAVRLTTVERWDPLRPLTLLPDGEQAKASFPLALALAGLAYASQDAAWKPASELRKRLAS